MKLFQLTPPSFSGVEVTFKRYMQSGTVASVLKRETLL